MADFGSVRPVPRSGFLAPGFQSAAAAAHSKKTQVLRTIDAFSKIAYVVFWAGRFRKKGLFELTGNSVTEVWNHSSHRIFEKALTLPEMVQRK